jgi:type IV secretory pathway TrbD component
MTGFEIPVHRSLTGPVLLGGVPREMAIINGTLAAVLGFGLQTWYAVPFCLAVHLVTVEVTKWDPQFVDCLRRHLRHKSYYST